MNKEDLPNCEKKTFLVGVSPFKHLSNTTFILVLLSWKILSSTSWLDGGHR